MSNKHFVSTLRLINEDDEFPSFVSFYANEEASDRKEIEAIYLTDADSEHMNEILEVEFVACNPARTSCSHAPIINYHNYSRI